jgi:hypothetical protein
MAGDDQKLDAASADSKTSLVSGSVDVSNSRVNTDLSWEKGRLTLENSTDADYQGHYYADTAASFNLKGRFSAVAEAVFDRSGDGVNSQTYLAGVSEGFSSSRLRTKGTLTAEFETSGRHFVTSVEAETELTKKLSVSEYADSDKSFKVDARYKLNKSGSVELTAGYHSMSGVKGPAGGIKFNF